MVGIHADTLDFARTRRRTPRTSRRVRLWTAAVIGAASFMLAPTEVRAEEYSSSITSVFGGASADEAGTINFSQSGVTATVATSPAAGGSVQSAATSTTSFFVQGTGSVRYTFQIVGNETTVVPVRVQASGFSRTTGFGEAGTTLSLDAGLGGSVFQILRSTTSNSVVEFDSFVIDEVYNFVSNTDNFVFLEAGARGGNFGSPGSSQSFIDPVFTIDSAFAGRFRIVGVPGAGDPTVPGIPEPASWAMMIIGFGAVGAALRGQRQMRSIPA